MDVVYRIHYVIGPPMNFNWDSCSCGPTREYTPSRPQHFTLSIVCAVSICVAHWLNGQFWGLFSSFWPLFYQKVCMPFRFLIFILVVFFDSFSWMALSVCLSVRPPTDTILVVCLIRSFRSYMLEGLGMPVRVLIWDVQGLIPDWFRDCCTDNLCVATFSGSGACFNMRGTFGTPSPESSVKPFDAWVITESSFSNIASHATIIV